MSRLSRCDADRASAALVELSYQLLLSCLEAAVDAHLQDAGFHGFSLAIRLTEVGSDY